MGLLRLVISTLSNYGRQCAFAIAPIPAYLPQYWTLCNTNDPILQRRKQLLHHPAHNQSSSKTQKPSSDIISGNINVENHFDSSSSGGGGGGGGTTASSTGGGSGQVTEGGFSSTSIMILLLSHAFRLQYFFISAILSTFYQTHNDNDNDADDDDNASPNTITAHHHDHRKADKVHFDLVMQSLVMIGIQLLLLSAVTRRRRLSNKEKVDDDDDNTSFTVSNSSIIPQQISSKKRSSSATTSSYKSSSLSQKPFIWIYKPGKHWHWDTVHQHVELLIVILLLEYIFFQHYIYPDSTIDYILTVKNISVLLESCLALPQMIMNYRRKSTDGLSLVMVIGWVMGDILKLLYFLAAYSKGSSSAGGSSSSLSSHHDEPSSDTGMLAFMIGSFFALVLDSIVVLQLIKWYPTKEFKSLMKRMRRWCSFLPRRFFRLQDTGISTMKTTMKKKRRGSSIDDYMP
mmetsp:Transcript_20991/g.31531  ORF Transcript_20991/g.31531 Transcript_20991/m.31531 type:complete len:458 (+) Transcript_20991:176-1549(+)